jgi:hypothetical protein
MIKLTHLLSFLVLFLLGMTADAQQKKNIYGYVEDAITQERLSGVVVVSKATNATTTTNAYGFFSLSLLSPANYILEIRSLGFKTQTLSLLLQKDTLLIIKLAPNVQQLDEVKIMEQTPPHQQTLGGYHRLSAQTIAKIPALAGEVDVLKSLLLLPGVQMGKEGTVGINVRGGTPDQNLVLLDGAPVYNINHLFGFLSVFNHDAVANVDFYKGGIPARYGGRLASVIDVSMREGNKERFEKKITLSPIASRLLIEGPLLKNRSSFLISARRTWLDALTTPIASLSNSDFRSVLKFYDVNIKLNHTFSVKDRLHLSYYTGRDGLNNSIKLGDGVSSFNYNWGNNTFVLRWNHLYNQRLFGNMAVNYTNFDYQLRNEVTDQRSFRSVFRSGISDWTFKYDWDLFATPAHALKFGTNVTLRRFTPEVQQIRTGQADTLFNPQPTVNGTEIGFYVEDEFKIKNILTANIGINGSFYGVNQSRYFYPQPRASVRFLTSSSSSVKLSYGRFAQYLHLLSNSSLGLPTDLWVSATGKVPPQQSNQFSLGYYKDLAKGRYSINVEGFYRTMQNVIEYKEGASFLNNRAQSWEEKVAVGNGKAYGVEFMLQKNVGKLKGWLSYTLSSSVRQFEELNQGRMFPYRYDSRHNLGLTLDYTLSKNKSLSFNFVYQSGTPLQISQTTYQGVFPHYLIGPVPGFNNSSYDLYYNYFNTLGLLSDRNTYRSPAYHRADFGYKTTKTLKRGPRTWTLGAYNIYSRNNPFFIYYDRNVLKQFSLFPILPSFSYERSF